MYTPDWISAHSLGHCTGRVEVWTGQRWTPRGTAFFIGQRTLLTCAHVIPPGSTVQVAVYLPPGSPAHQHGSKTAGGTLVKIPIESYQRHPNVPVSGDYPLPDVAILHVPDTFHQLPSCTARLDGAQPGDDLYVVGFTDEWTRGQALGYAARFRLAGPMEVEGKAVYRMQDDRLRRGLSGAPVMDLGTGRVVGIVKRSQDPDLPAGAFFVPVQDILPLLDDDVREENAKLDSDPTMNEALAKQLWGGLLDTATSCLEGNSAAREALAEKLGLAPPTGSDVAQARTVALKLFTLDLDDLFYKVKPLVERIGDKKAAALYNAVAACTSYKGEQWVAAEAAAELAAQVEILAAADSVTGRVIHLRAETELGRVYRRRANRNGEWGNALEFGVFSHEVDQITGLPTDLVRELRSRIIAKLPGAERQGRARGLDAPELDDEGKQRWDEIRPRIVDQMRKKRVVGILPDMTLDAALVERLAADYRMVFLVAGLTEHAEMSEVDAYQTLDPDVNNEHAYDAYLSYVTACDDLMSS